MKQKYPLMFLCLLIASTSEAQITWDTTRELSRHEGGYGTFEPSIKASIFYNGNPGIEAVVVKNNLSLVWLLSNTSTKYCGVQWIRNPNYKNGLFGVKGGAEVDFKFLHFGVGAFAQTDFKHVKLYGSPEIGVSWWGKVDIYYSYIILLSREDYIGNNSFQIGIKYNFTKDLFYEFKEGASYD